MRILPVQGTFSLRMLMKCQFEREVQIICQKRYFFTRKCQCCLLLALSFQVEKQKFH